MAKKKKAKKLSEIQILEAICERTAEEDKPWYPFLTAGSSKEKVEDLHKKKQIKKAGKGGGFKATSAGFDRCGYE